jgi:PAS domain S-box-containing protein/putative nucleotidyltransferase with HDIG domain
VLDVQSSELDAFNADDVFVLETLGNQVAIAIQNAFLFERIETALDALQVSEERFALAVQGANDGIWDWDIQKNSLYWSPRVKELLGYAEDELDITFDTLDSTLHPDDRDQTKSTIEARLKDGGLYRVDHRLRTKSGEYRWFRARGQVVFDEAGNPVRMVGSTADITGRKQAEERLHQTLRGIIDALGQIVDIRDPYTAGHQKRVTQLSIAIAKEMELSDEQIEGIRVAGLLHDIGKMSIPTEILSKPGQLSELERTLFKVHPKVAYDILPTVDFPWPIAQIVLQHHERMNGSGYPQGLKGKEIMLEARILTVADVTEAMASDRPYRPAFGIDEALEEISDNKGELYDLGVAEACLRLFNEKRFRFGD